MNTKAVIAAVLILVILSGVAAYFIKVNIDIKKSMEEFKKTQKDRFDKQFSKEKEKIKRDLEEKYRADMVSYRAMSIRLKREKEKIKNLEEGIKNLKNEVGKGHSSSEDVEILEKKLNKLKRGR